MKMDYEQLKYRYSYNLLAVSGYISLLLKIFFLVQNLNLYGTEATISLFLTYIFLELISFGLLGIFVILYIVEELYHFKIKLYKFMYSKFVDLIQILGIILFFIQLIVFVVFWFK